MGAGAERRLHPGEAGGRAGKGWGPGTGWAPWPLLQPGLAPPLQADAQTEAQAQLVGVPLQSQVSSRQQLYIPAQRPKVHPAPAPERLCADKPAAHALRQQRRLQRLLPSPAAAGTGLAGSGQRRREEGCIHAQRAQRTGHAIHVLRLARHCRLGLRWAGGGRRLGRACLELQGWSGRAARLNLCPSAAQLVGQETMALGQCSVGRARA